METVSYWAGSVVYHLIMPCPLLLSHLLPFPDRRMDVSGVPYLFTSVMFLWLLSPRTVSYRADTVAVNTSVVKIALKLFPNLCG